MKQKNPVGYALGKMSANKRFEGMTKEQISEIMRELSLRRKKKIDPLTSDRSI